MNNLPSEFYEYQLTHTYGGNGFPLILELDETYLLLWHNGWKQPVVARRDLVRVFEVPQEGGGVKRFPIHEDVRKQVGEIRTDLLLGRKTIWRGFLVPINHNGMELPRLEIAE